MQAVEKARRERLERVKALREAGNTYKQIANELGVSVDRVRQLMARANRPPKKEDDHPLSVRTRNCLKEAGYGDLNKLEVLRAFRRGDIQPTTMINYGLKSHLEVLEWLLESTEEPERCKIWCGTSKYGPLLAFYAATKEGVYDEIRRAVDGRKSISSEDLDVGYSVFSVTIDLTPEGVVSLLRQGS